MTWLRAPFLFLWVTPTVRRGRLHQLQQEDAEATAGWASSKTDDLLAKYDAFVGSYRRRLWLLVRWRLLGSGALYAVYCATQLLQPVLLRGVVRAVEEGRADGASFAVGIGLAGVVGSMAKEQQLFLNFRLGSVFNNSSQPTYRHRTANMPSSHVQAMSLHAYIHAPCSNVLSHGSLLYK